jgi:hypothetical protein
MSKYRTGIIYTLVLAFLMGWFGSFIIYFGDGVEAMIEFDLMLFITYLMIAGAIFVHTQLKR